MSESTRESSWTFGSAAARLGFTLIEVIGILAVLAILATVVLSTTTSSLDTAAANLENTNLVNYAAALQNSILRNRYIPGKNDWFTVIATELGVNVSSVTNTARNLPRYFLIDPAIQIGANAAGVLPYAQSNLFLNGASGQMTNLISPRVMIVSSVALSPSTQFPPFVTSGTLSETNFNNLWNWTDQSLNAPSDWPTSWNNYGRDLLVQRINLAPLFVHLTLQNYPPPPLSTIQGQYAIDRWATNPVPNSPYYNGVNAYLLKSTVLSLLQDVGSGGTPQADQVLSRDASFFYIQQVWRGTLAYGTNIIQSGLPAAVGSAFLATAQAFVSSPYCTNAPGMTPPIVMYDMSNFMTAYIASTTNASFYGLAKTNQTIMFNDMTSLVR
jgi:type II secretory pathway pseudopilin PulG